MLDEIVCHKLNILARAADLSSWVKLVQAQEHPEHESTSPSSASTFDLQDSYKSLNEALKHAGIHTRSKVNIHYVDSEELEKAASLRWRRWTRSWCPAASASAAEGKMRAIRHARENGIPYLGICLGMPAGDHRVRAHVCGLAGANSTEFDPDTPHPVVAADHRVARPHRPHREEDRESRPGRHDAPGRAEVPGRAEALSLLQFMAWKSMKGIVTATRSTNIYVPQLEAKGYRGVGPYAEREAARDDEIPGHPFFVGVQFHPRFTSTPRAGHPLFKGFRHRLHSSTAPARSVPGARCRSSRRETLWFRGRFG